MKMKIKMNPQERRVIRVKTRKEKSEHRSFIRESALGKIRNTDLLWKSEDSWKNSDHRSFGRERWLRGFPKQKPNTDLCCKGFSLSFYFKSIDKRTDINRVGKLPTTRYTVFKQNLDKFTHKNQIGTTKT